MIITENITLDGNQITFEWHDTDSFDELPWKECSQIYSVCVRPDNLIGLVTYDEARTNLPGGSIEHEIDTDFNAALRREINEELNSEVLTWSPIGYQVVYEQNKAPHFQLRAVAKVQPNGEFKFDSGGSVTGNIWVPIKDVNKHIQYRKIGNRLIERAQIKLSELN